MIHARSLAALMAAAVMAASSAVAAAPDPLWVRTVASVDGLRKLVAQDIDVDATETEDGKTERTAVKLRLTGWDKGEPVYAAVGPDAGKHTELDRGMGSFARLTAGKVTLNAPVTRLDNQMVGGRRLTLFQMAKSKMGYQYALKMWVDPVSGVPQVSETKGAAPLTAEIITITQYAEHPSLGLIETQSDMQMVSKVPFNSGKARLLTKPSNWVARP